MTIEEMIHGESKNVEFKVMLPKKSENYTKTIIAFANTQGGHLIVGIDDKTRKVVGIDKDFVFSVMDSISNAVSDSCVPQIVPNIEPQTIAGKTVIVVTVVPGANRPYYLKSKGRDDGTYIRVAGTTRLAHPEKIRELEMEGARISWDELVCVGCEATDRAVKKLCEDIMRYRREAGLSGREVTESQLINWKLLKKDGESTMASNAFMLLTSDYFPFSKTQCAVFKGIERSVFLDKREFTGPIYEQIEEATNFVLRNIRLGARIEGLVRKESYELPVEAIREMIINAHCHRNLSDSSCVQVAIYDDRLEVTSPGGLYNGLTYEEIMNGHSKLRNRVIANVFSQMGLVESWGTGIRRIMEAAKDYHLPVPEFQIFDEMVRVNLFRDLSQTTNQKNYSCISKNYRKRVGEASGKYQRNIGETSEKHRRNIGENLNDTQRKILVLLSEDEQLSAAKMAKRIGISSRNIESNIKKLRERGILIRHGSPKSGYWEINAGFGYDWEGKK
jgi:predicted HTH transcriptional regulator